MRGLAVLLIALAALPATPAFGDGPLTVEAAKRHLAAGDLDAIYLAFAGLEAGAHPDGDAAVVAVLVDAARAALEAEDAPLALGLCEVARRIDPASAGAALAYAAAALALEQRGAAEEVLDAALGHAPRDGELHFQRARLAEEEHDFETARTHYGRVPRRHARSAQAREGARRVTEALRERDATLREVAEVENALRERQEAAAERRGAGVDDGPATGTRRRPPPGDPGPSREAGLPAGMTSRDSQNFRIVYNRGDRDFAQRADFEHRVLGLFEDAHERVTRLFDWTPPEPVDVVLYTREEFDLHFGGRFGGSVLGFYAGKIRMNRAEDPTSPMFRRTVIHEYVHAVVDQLAGGRAERIPVWLNEGLAVWVELTLTRTRYGDGQSPAEQRYRQQMATAIPIHALGSISFAQVPDPDSAYMKSWAAVSALIGTGGNLQQVLRVIEETGAGRPFEEAFVDAFSQSRLERLDQEANRVLVR